MELNFFRLPEVYRLEPPPGILSLILLILGMAAMAYFLWSRRQDLRLMNPGTRRWLGLTLVLSVPASMFLILTRTHTAMLPYILPGVAHSPEISMMAMLVCLGIAYAFGTVPGFLGGIVFGLVSAWFTPHYMTDVFAYVVWGTVAGACLRQTYRGEFFNILRQPIVASGLASGLALVTMSVCRIAADQPVGDLVVFDYFIAFWENELWIWSLSGVFAGVIFQIIAMVPRYRLNIRGTESSFFSRSLRAQFTVIVLSLVFLGTLISGLYIPVRGVAVAREQLLAELARAAQSAEEDLLQYNVAGLNLVQAFSKDDRLQVDDYETRSRALQYDTGLVPYFRQLVFVSPNNEILAASPASAMNTTLIQDELDAIAEIRVDRYKRNTQFNGLPLGDNSTGHGISFIAPVLSSPSDLNSELIGFLIGRAELTLDSRMQGIREGGISFVVDANNRIIAHPDTTTLLQTWNGEESTIINPQPAYRAEDDRPVFHSFDGTEHVLVYVHQVPATGQRIVMQIPYARVLQTAGEIATPLLWVQIVFGVLLMGAIFYASSRVTRPLKALSDAANRITMGNLGGTIDLEGEDEVAQLGSVFETMRIHLQERLHDLSLLLTTTQKVSATLDMQEGAIPILDAASVETGARVARIVILAADGRPSHVYSVGEDNSEVMRLDRALSLVLMRRQSPLIIQDVANAQGISQTKTQLKSIAAFPVRTTKRVSAMLWVGSAQGDAFDEARVNFLTTLVHQAVVLMENAQLYQAAEGGRDRLAAILSSTTDAILVTDADSTVVLTNPAAKRIFGLETTEFGKPITDLGLPEDLVSAITTQTQAVKRVRRYQMAFPESVSDVMSKDQNESPFPSVEVPLDDGRVYYASIAPIRSKSGLTMGVVVVLRDVTRFKELDEMKSEFVSTVSHDLRRPLSYMRGYTTMLTMVGELNDKQREYAQLILEGVEQMNSLIGDLLNLRRVEAGVGVRREVCRLGMVLVEAVDTMRARANSKGVSLRLEPAEGAPMVMGDRTLLRQAITNLVDNAIKYTPSSGEVSVGLLVTEQQVVIRVTDNGIGIAPADQVRLFEKFYRIKRQDVEHIQGTGLGLALVKSIVEHHDGRVWVESALNRGSSFYIELPLPRSEDILID